MVYITTTLTPIGSPYLSAKNTGLGNALFQMASVYGLSKTYNLKCTFPYVKIYGDKLKSLYNFDHATTILRNLYMTTDLPENYNTIRYTKRHDNCNMNRSFDHQLIHLLQTSHENIEINGYMEVLQYFKSIRSEIQDIFSPDSTSEAYIQEKYGDILRSGKTLVSIHFRYGKDIPHNYNFSNDYYKKAIDIYRESDKESNIHLLIFSDNPENINFEAYGITDNYTVVSGNQDYIDLWLMAKCDRYIITSSTFCWWGIYLNRKQDIRILYETDYQNPYHPLDYSFTTHTVGI